MRLIHREESSDLLLWHLLKLLGVVFPPAGDSSPRGKEKLKNHTRPVTVGISDALTASLDAWNRIRDRNQDIVLVNHLLPLIACSTNRVPMGDEGQVTHESGFIHILV